jgi:hypothetical protein
MAPRQEQLGVRPACLGLIDCWPPEPTGGRAARRRDEVLDDSAVPEAERIGLEAGAVRPGAAHHRLLNSALARAHSPARSLLTIPPARQSRARTIR